MNLVVGFRCLVALVVLESSIGVPEPQRNSGTFGRGVRGGGGRLRGNTRDYVSRLGSFGSTNGQFGRSRGVSRAGVGNVTSIISSVLGSATAGAVIRGALAGAVEVINEENSNNSPCTPRRPHTYCQIPDTWRTVDSDGDGHVDSCDNCPSVANPDQADWDGNSFGDICDSHNDTDKDGIPDGIDNCINKANHDQINVDGDEEGDECDDDDDNDGISDLVDNCRLVANNNQVDTDNDGVGDACQGDFDGDCQPDHLDICPNDPNIHRPDLTHYHAVSLDNIELGQDQANFTVTDDGTTASQHINSKPGLMFGEHSLSDLDFSGTLAVGATAGDNDYVGFIFGYRDAKNFYVVMWKKEDQTNFECNDTSLGKSGLTLKRVHSNTGPSCELQNALWASTDTSDQVTVLWNDPNKTGWENGTAYHWELIHRPNKGLIRFRMFEGSPGSGFLVDSGNIYDDNIKSGYVGLYCHSQKGITWSNIKYGCNDLATTHHFDLVNPGECPPLRLRISLPLTKFCTIDNDCLNTEKCCVHPFLGKSVCNPSSFRQ